MTQEELDAIVDEAHALDKHCSCHCFTPTAQKMALKAGADTIDHCVFTDDEAIEMLVSEKKADRADPHASFRPRHRSAPAHRDLGIYLKQDENAATPYQRDLPALYQGRRQNRHGNRYPAGSRYRLQRRGTRNLRRLRDDAACRRSRRPPRTRPRPSGWER